MKKGACVPKTSLPVVLSLKDEGTDGPVEAEGVTKLLVPYVLQFLSSNALSLL